MFVKLLILNAELISAQDVISGIKEIGGSISEYGRTLVMGERSKIFVFDSRRNVNLGEYVSVYITSPIEEDVDPLYDRISRMLALSFSPNVMMHKMMTMPLDAVAKIESISNRKKMIGAETTDIPVNLSIDFPFLFALSKRPELIIERTQPFDTFLSQNKLGYHVEHVKAAEIETRTCDPETQQVTKAVEEKSRKTLSLDIMAAPRADVDTPDELWDCQFSFQYFDHFDSRIEIDLIKDTIKVIPDIREDTPLISLVTNRVPYKSKVAVRDTLNIAALSSRTNSVLSFETGIPEFLNLERTYLV